MPRPAMARCPAPVVGGNVVLCVPHVRNSPLNYTDPSGRRECQIICDGEVPNWRTYQDSAWLGDWDVEQQAANSAKAEAITTNTIETVVGMLWEPADWLIAFSDGFQWYDSFGMLPLLPATVGKYGDEFGHLAGPLIKRVDELHSQLDPFAQNKRTTAILLAADQQGNLHRLVASSEPRLTRQQMEALHQGEVAINEGLRGMHAEVRLLLSAEEQGLKGIFMAANRPICEECASLIAWYNVTPITPLRRP